MIKLFCLLCFASVGFATTWESSHFIWNLGLVSQCDVGPNKDPFTFFSDFSWDGPRALKKVQAGDLVWCAPEELEQIWAKGLSKLRHPIILMISGGDESFPSDYNIDVNQFISNPNIYHIFAQNCDYMGISSKITPIPIGLDFHTIAYKGYPSYWGETGSVKEQEEVLFTILDTLKPTHHRKIGAFVDFLHHTYKDKEGRDERGELFALLQDTGLIDYSEIPIARSDLWRQKGEYAFSISPHGNGLDCHRTWEDLALGCIVIVKTSPLDPLYKGLPVVIVNNWDEITLENMEQWLTEYGDAFHNPSFREKLTHAYWNEKIQAKKKKCLELQ